MPVRIGISGAVNPEALAADPAFSSKFVPLGDSSYIAKTSGDNADGVRQWVHDSASGYLDHLRTGANSGSGTYAIGIGTDKGAGGGILISCKNPSGVGLNIVQNKGAIFGAYLIGYDTDALVRADIHPGAGGFEIAATTGQAYNDGVTTNASTTFTSATATFVVGDVGQTIVQQTSRALNDPTGCIPAGTTIAAYVSPTQVTLSQPAGATGSGIIFRVGGRLPAATLSLLKFLDYDGTTKILDVTRTTVDVNGIPLNVTGAAATQREIAFQTGGVTRFKIRGASSTAESGSDAGSNFQINSYTDAGVFKTTLLELTRNVGNIGLRTTSYGSGQGVIGIGNATLAPSGNPTSGFVMWADAGVPKFRTSGGVILNFTQQTGTPAAATDLATALTLVNALRASLLNIGLVA